MSIFVVHLDNLDADILRKVHSLYSINVNFDNSLRDNWNRFGSPFLGCDFAYAIYFQVGQLPFFLLFRGVEALRCRLNWMMGSTLLFMFLTPKNNIVSLGLETFIYHMKKIYYASAIALCALLSSCGFTENATGNANLTETQVVLSQANYKVIGQVRGESKQHYVLFGIGGLSKKSCQHSAMMDMYQNADMQGGSRAVINSNITYRNSFHVLWGTRKAIATGTLIEFTK